MDPKSIVTATIIVCLLLIVGVFSLGLTLGRSLGAAAGPPGQKFRGAPPSGRRKR
jgi:hypothetical protein